VFLIAGRIIISIYHAKKMRNNGDMLFSGKTITKNEAGKIFFSFLLKIVGTPPTWWHNGGTLKQEMPT